MAEAVEARIVGGSQLVDRRGPANLETEQEVVAGGRHARCRVVRLCPHRASSQPDRRRRDEEPKPTRS